MKFKNQKMSGPSRLSRLSKVFALARGTAEMAKGMMQFHQIEAELEKAMEKNKKRTKPTTKMGKLRRRGEHLLHGKYVLLTVVILNVVDCLLVLGELMLDIKYVTDLLTSEYKRSENFIGEMKMTYPARLGYLGTQDIEALEHEILLATLTWDSRVTEINATNDSRTDNHTLSNEQRTPNGGIHVTSSTDSPNSNTRKRRSTEEQGNDTYPSAARYTDSHMDPTRSIEVKVVQGLHKTSITILIILTCETLFKIFCFGRQMLQYKLECFDGFVVIASFIVDVVFIKGLQQFTVQEYILILAFIVPWRIIRVVNSLVVAINCHEHFRLVIVYKQTKKISKELKEVKEDNKRLESCVEVLKKLCAEAGLSDNLIKTKIDSFRSERQKAKAKSKANGNLSHLKTENTDKLDTQGLERYTTQHEDDNDIGGVDNIVVRL